MNENTKALWAAILAFSCWGLFPIYWKFFPELGGDDLFIYRLFWSMITLCCIVVYKNKLPVIRELLGTKLLWWLLLSAILISSNWLLYTVAVTEGKIIEASLGYFLNPLLNVVLGFLFLKETLRASQWPAIILAIIGVVSMGLSSGVLGFPWVALWLSLTFAAYGLIRKWTKVGSLEGLSVETSLVFLPFMAWWFYRGGSPAATLASIGWGKMSLLALSGIITCTPLILFAYAARRLTLQTLGFTQYLSPSFKFLCGWAIFGEPMSSERWVGFLFIWAGLAWYSIEQVRHSRLKLKAEVTNL